MADDMNIAIVLRLVDRLTGPIKPVLSQLSELDGGLGSIGSNAQLAGRGLSKIGEGARTGLGILAGYGAATALITQQLLAPARQFERFQTVLETTEGSSEAAKNAMAWVEDFATRTPFELDKVMEAYVQLRAYGLDPTTGLLRDLGDTASAMNKDIVQAVEAIADAVTGENERLKEFGIKAAKEGSDFIYAYTVDGVRKQIAAAADDPAAIEAALRQIFQQRFAGAMEREAQTFDGILSNLFDLWTGFQRRIMGNGLFDWMKGELQAILDLANSMAADGTLDLWAKEIGKNIQETLQVMRELAVGLIGVAREAGPWLEWAAEKLGGWNELALAFLALPFASTFVSLAFGIAFVGKALVGIGAALLANPVVAVITAIALSVYAIYDNWNGIVAYFAEKIERISAAFDEGFMAGVIAILEEFDPIQIFVDAFTGLVEWITGYRLDFQWKDILPDWSWSDIVPDFGWGSDDGDGLRGDRRRGRVAVSSDASPLVGASGGGGDNVTVGDIHVHPSPGMNEEALANRVAERIREPQGAARRGARRDRRLYDDAGYGNAE